MRLRLREATQYSIVTQCTQRGAGKGGNIPCTKATHATRFFRANCTVSHVTVSGVATVLYGMLLTVSGVTMQHNATQTLSCNTVARLKPRYAGGLHYATQP